VIIVKTRAQARTCQNSERIRMGREFLHIIREAKRVYRSEQVLIPKPEDKVPRLKSGYENIKFSYE